MFYPKVQVCVSYSNLSPETQAIVRNALRALPMRERAVIMHRFFSGNAALTKEQRTAFRHIRKVLASNGIYVWAGLPSIITSAMDDIISLSAVYGAAS